MLAFHLSKAGQHGANAETLRIATVNTGKQRLGYAIDHLLAKMATHKVAHGFVTGIFSGRRKQFRRHTQFCLEGKQRRCRHRPDTCRDHELQSIRDRDKFSFDQDVSFATDVIRRNQLIANSQFLAEP